MNADPEKLARVFSNLLRNAASYSYPQTEITIFAKRLEHDIQITFENHGKTIPQEQLNSIFEKFNRLDDARLSNTGGAGLKRVIFEIEKPLFGTMIIDQGLFIVQLKQKKGV